MSAPEAVLELVDRFHRNLAAYKQGKYNETQVRREFIDPFFEVLGWDVDNKQGYAEQYKDVVHEATVKVGGKTKAPDYSFRIGGVRKFFVEAKKPSVDVKDDIHPAYQLRRYAWSAKLPLSILTDFEEFAVYDCRIRPIKTDKTSTARVMYIRYDEYVERWDEIVNIFSQDAINKGSFDKYVESHKAKRGTAEVDSAFLEEISRWRELLARNIALRNPGLTQRALNFAVQRTIDRLIFLRIAEDRGLEPYGGLRDLVTGKDIYQNLLLNFHQADDRYNSGLFHFGQEKGRGEPDLLTPQIAIDDKVLKDILKHLYYPDSPYEFSVLPADILGQVYEQFLGKVIRLTPGGRAKIEEKPEVRKAGGVYYTPTYIVDYIVEQTVGKLVDGKTPEKVSKLRVLDPACGSGSFLLGAYQYLLDWHQKYYIDHDPQRWTRSRPPRLFETGKGEWALTIDERKRILLDNIYGVDIDPQAVEVTKLSLLLKVLEGESAQAGPQLSLLQERVLPDLAANIQCGNSLIGPDFYESQQLSLLDDEETMYRINAFDWAEGFPEATAAGGFDAVIGNPPYIRMESFKDIKEYLRLHFQTHADRADIYFYFVEKAGKLLRNNGRFSFILSNTFTRSRAGGALRAYISNELVIDRLVEFGNFTPFADASVYPIIVVAQNSGQSTSPVDFIVQNQKPIGGALENSFPVVYHLDHVKFGEGIWSLEDPKASALRENLLNAFPSLVDQFGRVGMGIKSGLNKAFILSDERRNQILQLNPGAQAIIKPYLGGKNLDHYFYEWEKEWLIYTPHGIDMEPYPAITDFLRIFKSSLEKRATDQNWYELQQPQLVYASKFDHPKIIFPDISRYPKFNLDAQGFYFSNTVYFIDTDSVYLLGILNSKLIWFLIRGMSNALRGGMWRFRLFSGHIERLPIRPIDFSNPTDVAYHDQMVAHVQRMLDLHKRLAAAKEPHTRKLLQQQIDLTDQAIDRMVYELYELTEEEIAIIEGPGDSR